MKSNKITVPHPFNLETDKRGNTYVSSWKKKLAEEEEERRQKASFVAQPLPSEEVFVPERSQKPLTEVDDFVLATEIRSEARASFEEALKKRTEEEEAEKEESERKEKVFEI